MDSIHGEPRLCPECGRYLEFLNGQYLCWDCWIIYKLEETKPHPYRGELCEFEVSEAEAAVYLYCPKCHKAISYDRDEYERVLQKHRDMFSPERVHEMRQKKLEQDESIRKEIEELKRKDEAERFVRSLSPEQIQQLKEQLEEG